MKEEETKNVCGNYQNKVFNELWFFIKAVNADWTLTGKNGICLYVYASTASDGSGLVQIGPYVEDGRFNDVWGSCDGVFTYEDPQSVKRADLESWFTQTIYKCYKAVSLAAAEQVFNRACEMIDGLTDDEKTQKHQFIDWNYICVTADHVKFDKWLIKVTPLRPRLKPNGWDSQKDGLFLWDCVDGKRSDVRNWLCDTVNGFFGNE